MQVFKDFDTQLDGHLKFGCRDDGERAQTQLCIDFLRDDPTCFDRTNLQGHFTGSAVVTDTETHSFMLMTLHRKAGRWLHLGGHCDGLPQPFVTAWTEAHEESGLRSVLPVDIRIFDIDIHDVAPHLEVAGHKHYDIRYWFTARRSEPLIISDESMQLEWVPIRQVLERNSDPIVSKLIYKLSFLI